MVTLLRTLLLLAVAGPPLVSAQQPIKLENVPEGLPVISADEPLTAEFSALKAAEYLVLPGSL